MNYKALFIISKELSLKQKKKTFLFGGILTKYLKYKKFKYPDISYIFTEAVVLSIIIHKHGNNNDATLREEKISQEFTFKKIDEIKFLFLEEKI